MAEIIFRGARMWDGTTAEEVGHRDFKDVLPGERFIPRHWVLKPPSGDEIHAQPGEEIIIDNEIVSGPRVGWKFEDRPVGPHLKRPMGYRGKHAESCESTEDGWICRRGCTVSDERQASTYTNTVDTFMDVVIGTSRPRWFKKISWTISRKSHQQTFRNGRSFDPQDTIVSIQQWYSGSAWTKWGARHQIDDRLSGDRWRIK